MKCLSLFTGIGGFDLALKRKGHEIVGACEIDKYARLIYARHFPGVPIWEDATKINPEELPDFELLVAGFPCQAFSIAGKRLGFEESRGTLFFEIARIAKQKRPRLLLLENVKGLLSHDRGKTFANILATLDELGYDAQWQVLNSKYFVPQNRERVFIIGHLRGESRSKVFPISTSHSIPNSTRSETQGERKWISGTIDSNYHKGGSRTMIELVRLNNQDPSYNGIPTPSDNSFTITTKGGNEFGIVEPKLIAWSQSHRENGKVESRIKENEANTLNTGDGCRTQSSATFVKEYKKIRKLTPLECERLQGFPDGYTDGLSDTQRYKCLGNAVTVPVISFILERLN